MKLVYFRGAHPNFGDDLNAVLWPALAPELFGPTAPAPEHGVLGIGTIIGMAAPGAERLHVMSSGVGYSPIEPADPPRRLWCVRGPLSARALGADPDVALTDGAILSPRVITAPASSGETVVAPHYESLLAGGWQAACAAAGMRLVDPTGAPEPVIQAIAAAKLVITESLHGAIVADTYGVPWIAFAASGNFSVFKWTDWTRSVGVDLRVHVAPAPDARAVLRYGRPTLGAFGQEVAPDDAAVWEEFSRRTRPAEASAPAAAGLKSMAKAALQRSPLRRALGFSPARTAEALTAIAKARPNLSAAPLREDLADRMADRLAALAREAREGRL